MNNNIDIEELQKELEEVKMKLKDDIDFKENLKHYNRLNNRIRYWIDEDYRKASQIKALNWKMKMKEQKVQLVV